MPSGFVEIANIAGADWRVELVLAVTVVAGLLVASRPVARRLASSFGLALAVGVAAASATDPTALVLAVTALLLLLGGPAAVGAPGLVLAVLGLVLACEASTLAQLLTGLVLTIVGAMGARPDEDDVRTLACVGFATVAFAGALWSALGGATAWAEALAGLATRPLLPPLAVPLVGGLLLLGLLIALLPFGRGMAADSPLAVWLTIAPIVALAVIPWRILAAGTEAVPTALLPVMVTGGAVLAVGSFAAALTDQDLAQRLRRAAPGQLGMVWLGGGLLGPSATVPTVIGGVMVYAAAHASAVLLLPEARAGRRGRLLVSVLLMTMAGTPLLAGWPARAELLGGLLSEESYVTVSVAVVATILGFVVYWQPVVALWRRPASEAPTPVPVAGRVAAWSLGLGVIGLGVWTLAAGAVQ